MASTAVSAPGKVLLAGGYTVLDPSCRGLVFALSARIHCVATPSQDPSAPPGKITVRSPQFQDAIWEYQVSASDEDEAGGKAVSVVQTNEGDSNPFVLTTLKYTLSYLSLPVPPPTTLTILADNPYYSQPPPPIPRFNSLPFPIKSAYKTGLGSSAALVTSLTSSILLHFLQNSSETKLPPHIFHNLAQASHCAAQGKVGSGFDVAAATYGSCIYRRFPPEILTAIPDPTDPEFTKILKETVNKPWTSMESTPITLPPQIGLVMGDVQCGSSTPGMVKTVLSWRKSGGEDAELVWKQLNSRNEDLISTIKDIINDSNNNNEDYIDTIKQRITAIREMVRELGTKAAVKIEPESQTKLLDAAANDVEGVIGGVVPGAGGFDAVCFLYERKDGVEQNLREFLGNWEVENGVVKALELGQEGEGVRVEKLEGYQDVKAYFEGIAEL
ncbi:phosphomevalonate kinase [Orbilia oligospora]|uniref:Phosphomevalonate kinase n=1 Tax=Orbilia oligospora TaxID=2813651 RepID=A0A7C8QAB1_ORBOL|nr:phosphomevalonate kinase [Orbilia oligospora]